MYVRRGIGAVDLFGECTGVLNLFNLVNPDCYALAFPETTGAIATVTGHPGVTPEQMSAPSSAYPNPPVTTPNLAPPSSILTTPPASATEAQGTISDIVAQNQAAIDAQNQAFFNNLAAGGNAPTTSPCAVAFFGEQSCIGPFGTTTALLLAAVLVFFLARGR
jgi:hypothetical protein